MMKRSAALPASVAGVLLALVMPAPSTASGAEAKVSIKAYFASDFRDEAYQKEALQKVLGAWKASASLPRSGRKTVVISTIGRDGKLLEARLHLKSGNDTFDRAAMAAVRAASPYAPLPKSTSGLSVEVHWHFEVGS